MNIAASVILILSTCAVSRAKEATNWLNLVSTPDDSAVDVLESEDCASFGESVLGKINFWLDQYSDDTLKHYICNPLELDMLKQNMEHIEKIYDTETDPCKKAYEEILLE